MTLHDLIDHYWDLAYAEGKEGRSTDTSNGDAQDTRHAIDATLEAQSAQIADLKRALDTARHDAMEEAAQAPHVWRFRSPQARGWMPWQLGPAPDDMGAWLQQHEIQEVAASRQTKDQSHGA